MQYDRNLACIRVKHLKNIKKLLLVGSILLIGLSSYFLGYSSAILYNWHKTGTFVMHPSVERAYLRELNNALDDAPFDKILDKNLPVFPNKEMALFSINYYVNHKFQYQSDILTYGRLEYWAKPSEAIAHGYKMDCEDYAVAKYKMLLKAGFKKEELHLLLVHMRIPAIATADGVAVDGYHAILQVNINGKLVLLDLFDEILYSNPFYTTLYRLNENGIVKINDDTE